METGHWRVHEEDVDYLPSLESIERRRLKALEWIRAQEVANVSVVRVPGRLDLRMQQRSKLKAIDIAGCR